MSKIKNEKQYKALLSRIDEIFFATDENTPADDPRLLELDLLSALVEEYEKEHFPIETPSLPAVMNERLTESQVNEMVTDMLAVYVTRETMQNECQPKGDYATMTDIPDLSEYAKTSALDDYLLKEDASNSYQPVGEYLVKSDLDGYAKQTNIPAMPDVPTKVSELENDSEFLVAADLDEYAKKSDVPENISAFTNDAGYLTEHQSLDEYATKSDLD